MTHRITIHDNRDGSTEVVAVRSQEADGRNVRANVAESFRAAAEECTRRNEREGWSRFVPVNCVRLDR